MDFRQSEQSFVNLCHLCQKSSDYSEALGIKLYNSVKLQIMPDMLTVHHARLSKLPFVSELQRTFGAGILKCGIILPLLLPLVNKTGIKWGEARRVKYCYWLKKSAKLPKIKFMKILKTYFPFPLQKLPH